MTTLVILCAFVSWFAALMLGIKNNNKSLIAASFVPLVIGVIQIVMLLV